MESPAGGLCGVPYHALNGASFVCRYNSVGMGQRTWTCLKGQGLEQA